MEKRTKRERLTVLMEKRRKKEKLAVLIEKRRIKECLEWCGKVFTRIGRCNRRCWLLRKDWLS